jgi:Family of unknown function (DUF6334)
LIIGWHDLCMPPDETDPLRLVHDEGLRLRRVTAGVTAAPPAARHPRTLTLDFDGVRVVFVACVDDSIAVCAAADAQAPEDDEHVDHVDLTDEAPWRAAVGKPLMWTWSMTNQQGYRDAFQLEFAVDTSDTSVVIQLIVLSSWVHIRLVDEAYLPPVGTG